MSCLSVGSGTVWLQRLGTLVKNGDGVFTLISVGQGNFWGVNLK